MRLTAGPLSNVEEHETRVARLAPWLIAGLGATGSLLLLGSLRAGEVAAAETVFGMDAARGIARVQRELDAKLQQLHSTVALFDSSDTVEAEEFATFTAGSLLRHPELRAIVWIRGAEGPWKVHYSEGPEASTFRAGVDLAPDPVLGAALAAARAESRPTVSALAPIGNGPRVLLAVPVNPERHAGFVAGWLDLEQLLRRASEMPEHEEFAFALDDVSGGGVALAGDAGEGYPSLERELELGGRRWRMTCTAPPYFIANHRTLWPWVALILGLMATGLCSVTVTSATGRARIQHLVDRRTSEVQAAYDAITQEAKERAWAMQRTRDLQVQLRQIVDLVPDMIYVKDWHGRFRIANRAAADAYGTTVEELTASAGVDVNTESTPPDETLREERALMEAGLSSIQRATPFVDAQGRHRILRTAKIPFEVFGEDTPALLCVSTDITDARHAEDILRAQTLILGKLARGESPDSVLKLLVNVAEQIVPGLRASVLLLDPDGQHLRGLAAPSLPAFYNEAIDGLEIGPTAGSCGAAAHCGKRVVVRDVMEHPNWAPYRDLALKANFRACWSQPIRSAGGEILGTFAMYYTRPQTPEPFEENLLESMANLAGIAIERGEIRAG